MRPECFLAPFSDRPCDGRLVRAHLLPRQLLKRQWRQLSPPPMTEQELIDDPRTWVPACGGIVGNAGCHGRHDHHQLTIPRLLLPEGVEEIAAELGLGWYLDRRYGLAQNAA